MWIPLGFPNMKEAIDKAIEKYPGAIGLVDGVVKSKGWTAILYGQNSYVVEGTPLYEADAEKWGFQYLRKMFRQVKQCCFSMK